MALQSDDAVLGKFDKSFFTAGEQEGKQSREIREVASNQDVAGFATQSIPESRRGIVGLKIRCGAQVREGIAGAPKYLGRLPRA